MPANKVFRGSLKLLILFYSVVFLLKKEKFLHACKLLSVKVKTHNVWHKVNYSQKLLKAEFRMIIVDDS